MQLYDVGIRRRLRTDDTRITAPVMTNLAPGADVTNCQYVQAPLDHDMDVLDVTGYQSLGGHHSVAYATTMDVPLGTSRACNDDDNLASGFLGGTGGEPTAVSSSCMKIRLGVTRCSSIRTTARGRWTSR
jgi:hypothetical protein